MMTQTERTNKLQKELYRLKAVSSSSGGSGGTDEELVEAVNTVIEILSGGTPGQHLLKAGWDDFEIEWRDYLYYDAELGALIYTHFGDES